MAKHVVIAANEDGRWYWMGGQCWSMQRQEAKPVSLTQACDVRDRVRRTANGMFFQRIVRLPRRNHETRRNIKRAFNARMNKYEGY
jgi:hypothetical protein